MRPLKRSSMPLVSDFVEALVVVPNQVLDVPLQMTMLPLVLKGTIASKAIKRSLMAITMAPCRKRLWWRFLRQKCCTSRSFFDEGSESLEGI